MYFYFVIIFLKEAPITFCKHCLGNMYADETVYISVFKLYTLLFYINQDLQCFPEWLQGKSLVLNVFSKLRSPNFLRVVVMVLVLGIKRKLVDVTVVVVTAAAGVVVVMVV